MNAIKSLEQQYNLVLLSVTNADISLIWISDIPAICLTPENRLAHE